MARFNFVPAAIVSVAMMLLLVPLHVVRAGNWGCDSPVPYPLTMIETGMKKFYESTKGPTQWPDIYKSGWANPHYCAWDGNERGTPAPFGTRCATNNAWHKPPPEGDGGLMFVEHLSGMAEGPIPDEFKSFRMIDAIILHGNKISGTLWDTSTHCFLHRLDLSDNQMTGTIPSNFMRDAKEHSEIINLSGNQFDGTLPTQLNDLVALTALVLSRNKFSGPIPDLSHLERLRHLDLANNRFEGTLGSWISQLKNIAWLHLDNNQLSGALPPRLPPLISRFTASGNGFSGEIPAAYAEAPLLRHFNCTGCKLTCPRADLLAHLPFSTHCTERKRDW